VSTYVLSTNASFIDAVKAALKADSLQAFSAAPDVVSALLASSRSRWELVIVDVGSVRDGGRLIDFIKSSAPVRAIRILAVGSPAELATLGNVPGGTADATLEAGRVTEIAEAVAKLRADLGTPGGVRAPEGGVGFPPQTAR
jgi:hypothetical protein